MKLMKKNQVKKSMKKRNNKKKNTQSNFSKLSIFQNQKYKFKKKMSLIWKRSAGS